MRQLAQPRIAPGSIRPGRKRAAPSLLAAALLLSFLLPLPAAAQGRTGIPEIDSLPLNDWREPGPPLSYSAALGWSLLPGGGQFYGGHPVRGGFLVGLETILAGLAAYSYLVDVPRWRSQAGEFLDSADAAFLQDMQSPGSDPSLQGRRRDFVQLARERADLASRQLDLARSQAAWAAGLHLYGMLDAIEIAYLSRHPDGKDRNVRSAMYRGMLLPGGGQLYNRRYGKFGMLWMALGASSISAWSRQQVVDQLNARLRVARAEGSPAVGDLERDRTLYRKRRNQYFWGMALLYMYAIMDGMVDAALSDFDTPDKFATGPVPDPHLHPRPHHIAVGLEPGGELSMELRLPF